MTNDLVTIVTLADPLEARMLKDLLAGEGIDAFIPNELMAESVMPLASVQGGVAVQVRAADEAAARDIVDHIPSLADNSEDEEDEDDFEDEMPLLPHGDDTLPRGPGAI